MQKMRSLKHFISHYQKGITVIIHIENLSYAIFNSISKATLPKYALSTNNEQYTKLKCYALILMVVYR